MAGFHGVQTGPEEDSLLVEARHLLFLALLLPPIAAAAGPLMFGQSHLNKPLLMHRAKLVKSGDMTFLHDDSYVLLLGRGGQA